jgi:hypothetical protein
MEVVAHPTHSLFYMAEALRGEPHHSPGMAREFSGRVGDWSAIEASLPAYQKFFDQGTQRYPALKRKRTLGPVRVSGVVEEGIPDEGFVVCWGRGTVPQQQTSRGWRLDFGGTQSELFEMLTRLKQQLYLEPF